MAAFLSAIGTLGVTTAVRGQEPTPETQSPSSASESAERSSEQSAQNFAPKKRDGLSVENRNPERQSTRFIKDQEEIWTSPGRLRLSDMQWLMPVAGFTSFLFATDSEVSKHLSRNPTTLSHYNKLSNAGVAVLVGAGGGLWLASHVTHNNHWRETGFLAGEAALNSLAMTEGMKYSLRRERPFQGNGGGTFFNTGGTSFPSEHATLAWSIAGIFAHEYPGPLTKLMAYGLASAVSISRVRARQHFPSDTFVGAMVGELIAQHIFSEHHDPDLGGAVWEPIGRIFMDDGAAAPGNQGSPYVSLDSWVYPALDRLAGLGLIDGGFAGMRPWTRRECARLLDEAQEKLGDREYEDTEATRLIASLQREFRFELEGASGGASRAFQPESVYMRAENISGAPLHDGYHFAQTQINDFGRPYGEGWNTVTGFSTYGTLGMWTGYVRGEWQTAPAVPALPLTARETIEKADFLHQLPPDTGKSAVNQFRLLDAYVGLTASNWEFSFGKQSLLWGPGEGGPMMFSDNAAPINMVRVNRVTPLKLPSILGWLGPIRTEFFLGQLEGAEFILTPSGLVGQFGQALSSQPYINGQKISFKPTRNFEFGLSRTTIYGGPGYPLTLHTFLRSIVSTENKGTVGTARKPGDRRSGVDFSYRIPKLRNWLSFYGDGFTDDEFSPIGYFDRSAWHAGLYLSHIPGFQKLDLRVEGVYTDNPLGGALGRGFYYFNNTWRNGYTNDGDLIGSWIGREGQGAQAWSTYWFSPRNKIQFQFRHQKVSNEFIQGGGTVTDGGVNAEYSIRPDLEISANVQLERWNFPVLAQKAQSNVRSSLQVTFWPRGWNK